MMSGSRYLYKERGGREQRAQPGVILQPSLKFCPPTFSLSPLGFGNPTQTPEMRYLKVTRLIKILHKDMDQEVGTS